MSKELFNEALRYVNANFREHISEAEEEHALEVVNEYRCPIDNHIIDTIEELMQDFTFTNDIEDEDWWRDFADDGEDIYWMLGDLEEKESV